VQFLTIAIVEMALFVFGYKIKFKKNELKMQMFFFDIGNKKT
jgi:hypothetical protein